jgi:putative tryptophan/tyrosine transport system substrate-binding protein
VRDYFDAGREAAALAARIMRGEEPGKIPFQPLGGSRILVNLEAARAVGLDIPPSLLARATAVGGR